jgi:hypothetical protein
MPQPIGVKKTMHHHRPTRRSKRVRAAYIARRSQSSAATGSCPVLEALGAG